MYTIRQGLQKSGVSIANAVGDRDFWISANELDAKDNCTLDDLKAHTRWTKCYLTILTLWCMLLEIPCMFLGNIIIVTLVLDTPTIIRMFLRIVVEYVT